MCRNKSLLLYLLLYTGAGNNYMQAAAWIPSASTVSYYAGKMNPLTWSAATQRRLGTGLAAAALLGGTGYALYNYYYSTQSPANLTNLSEQSPANLTNLSEKFTELSTSLKNNDNATWEDKLSILKEMSTTINQMHSIMSNNSAYDSIAANNDQNRDNTIEGAEKKFFTTIGDLLHNNGQLLAKYIRDSLLELINQTTIQYTISAKNAYLDMLNPNKSSQPAGSSKPSEVSPEHDLQKPSLAQLKSDLYALNINENATQTNRNTLNTLKTKLDELKTNASSKGQQKLRPFEKEVATYEAVNQLLQDIANATLSNVESLQEKETRTINLIDVHIPDNARKRYLTKTVTQTFAQKKNKLIQAAQEAQRQEEQQAEHEREQAELEQKNLQYAQNEKQILEEKNKEVQTQKKEHDVSVSPEQQATQQVEQKAINKQEHASPLEKPEIKPAKQTSVQEVAPEIKEQTEESNIVIQQATNLIKRLKEIKVDKPEDAQKELSELQQEFTTIKPKLNAVQAALFTQQFNEAQDQTLKDITSKQNELKAQSAPEQTEQLEQPTPSHTEQTAQTPLMSQTSAISAQPIAIASPSTELLLPPTQPLTQPTVTAVETITAVPGSKEAEKEQETTMRQSQLYKDLESMLTEKKPLDQIRRNFNNSKNELTSDQQENFEKLLKDAEQYQADVTTYLQTYTKRIDNVKNDKKARDLLSTIKKDFEQDKNIAALEQSRKDALIERFNEKYNTKLSKINDNNRKGPQQAGAGSSAQTNTASMIAQIPKTTVNIINDSTYTIFLTGKYNSTIPQEAEKITMPQQNIPIKNDNGQDFYTLAPGASYKLQGDVNSVNIEYVPLRGFQNEETVTKNIKDYPHYPIIKKYEPYTITHLPKEPLTIHINSGFTTFYNTITPDAVTLLDNPTLNEISYEDLDLKSVYKPYEILQVANNADYKAINEKITSYKTKFTTKDPKAIAALQLVQRAAFYAQAGSKQQKKMLTALGEKINTTLLNLKPMPIEAGEIIKDDKTQVSTYIPNVSWDDKYPPLLSMQQPLLEQFGYGDQKQFVKLYMARALILYYYYLARKEGHIFNEGTFVVSDYKNGVGALFNFLVNMPNTHMRSASHFNSLAEISPQEFAHLKQTKFPVSENFYEFELPDLAKDAQLEKGEHPKTTILFNKLETSSKPFSNDGSSSSSPLEFRTTPLRLFIKPETFSTKGFYNKFRHGVEYLQSLTRRSVNQGDANDIPEYSKERVPQYLIKKFNELLSTTIDNIHKTNLKQEEKDRLTKNVEKFYLHAKDDSFGIQTMYRLTNPEVLKKSSNFDDSLIITYARDAAKQLHTLLESERDSDDPIKRAKRTDLEQRFGNEVILHPNKYLPFLKKNPPKKKSNS